MFIVYKNYNDSEMRKLNINKFCKNKRSGFTIVEVAVVIAVIGILTVVTVVGYNGWTKRVIETQIKSDLNGASSAMESYRTFNDKYSDSIPTTFKPSQDIVLSGGGLGGGIEFCIDASSQKDSSIHYYIDQDNSKNPQSGTCASRPKKWAQIVTGANHTCAITTLGKGYCWGSNTYGSLGNNSTTNSSVPVAIDDSGVLSGKTLKNIFAGNNYTCAIASDGIAYCWGKNNLGQLGDGTFVNKLVPTAISMSGALAGKRLLSMAASGGAEHTCAIASDQRAYCWGSNGSGQLGNNSTINSSTPVAVVYSGALKDKTIKSISTSGIIGHTCVIASDSQAYCWGNNNLGLLGDGTTNTSYVPVPVMRSGLLAGKIISDISTGDNNTCLISSDGFLYCWGANSSGAVGDGTVIDKLVPTAVDTSGVLSGKKLSKIYAGGGNNGHPCVVASSDVYCWGYGGLGALGNGSTNNSSVPVGIDKTGILNGKNIIMMSVGADHVCTIASDKYSYCWGWGGDGQLGNGTSVRSLVPVRVSEPL